MLRIIKVEHASEYKLKLLFSDEKIKIVDFSQWLNDSEYLHPLKDIKYFKKVKMDDFNYTICWPNGADFCPDTLYEIGVEIPVQDKILKPLAKRHTQKTVRSVRVKARDSKTSKKI